MHVKFSEAELLRGMRSFAFQAEVCSFGQIAWHALCREIVDPVAEQWSTLELYAATGDFVEDLLIRGYIEQALVTEEDEEFYYRVTDAGRDFIQSGFGSFSA